MRPRPQHNASGHSRPSMSLSQSPATSNDLRSSQLFWLSLSVNNPQQHSLGRLQQMVFKLLPETGRVLPLRVHHARPRPASSEIGASAFHPPTDQIFQSGPAVNTNLQSP